MALTFIDLGLPSGRLWATENAVIDGKTYFNFDEAVEAFGDMLPSLEAWIELHCQCKFIWDIYRQGWVLTGPNGNTLFLPADGYRRWNGHTYDGANKYWSSTSNVGGAWNVSFDRFHFNPTGSSIRLDAFTVRLCKPAGAQ